MSRILLAGHRGFIGGVVKDRFEYEDVDFCTLECDFNDISCLEKELQEVENIEILVFLIGGFSGDFESLLRSNLYPLQNIISLLAHKGLNKVIFSSTGAVYGEPSKDISKESDNVLPVTLYGLVKLYCERLLEYYKTTIGLNYIILRFPNVYGPLNSKGVIYHFLNGIESSNIITIYGTGEQQRNFLYVDDAASAIMKSIDYENSNTFNISSSELYSLIDMTKILKSLNMDFEVSFENAEDDNILKVLNLDISRASKELNWEPKVYLKEGLAKVIKSRSH